jgi:beta-galactosidase
MKPRSLLYLAVFLSAFASVASSAEFSRVAYDDAGAAEKEPHLTNGLDWRFPGNAAAEAALTAAFADRVEFGYAGLNPKAKYKVKLRFFSDSPREERVLAGGAVVLDSVKLEAGKVAEREIELPAAAFAGGSLTLVVERISGPNAVVSEVEVLSTDPQQLQPIPLPEPPLPLLTPRPVAGIMELGGTWKFAPAATAGFEKESAHDDWSDIRVPGEWAMQGFRVEPNTPAACFRSFTIAEPSPGQRLKLRFASVYSLCRVWLNGVEVGRHEGGFLPFECDVTRAVRAGRNELALSVQSESTMDQLACGSQYASHPLGGINRKVQLFSVPEVHLSDLKVETSFDRAFRDATLTVKLAIRNESDRTSSGEATIAVAPLGDSPKIDAVPATVRWSGVAAGETWRGTATIAVQNPGKWDNEHPRLYRLTVLAKNAAGSPETVEQTFGFRLVEVRGNRVFVNGTPIKIRGVCRHEVHPLLGRALDERWWKKDAEIFREGNCNFIRTSHYPPAEEFLDQCDRLGLFVELEAPLCWVGHGANDHIKVPPQDEAMFQRLAQANLETVQGYPNHPSVIMRSLANESTWSKLFARVHRAVRRADPTLPCTFHDQCWGSDGGSKEMEIAVIHYPGPSGPDSCRQMTRPVHFGEYCHLEAYNRREMATDPGLRDLWGQSLHAIWEKMLASPGCFGGSIWSGIDDTFFLPSGETVGYGAWGPIDGWRRPKPEFWQMKKTYSPLRVLATSVPLPTAGQPLRVEVENRCQFSDLGEMRFEWKLGQQSGTATASAPPGGKGVLEIPVQGGRIGGRLLELQAISPRGFVVDVWQVAIGTDPRIAPPVLANPPSGMKYEKKDGAFVISDGRSAVTVDTATGKIKATGNRGRTSVISGPELMLLPANGDLVCGMQMSGPEREIPIFSDTCHDWKPTAASASKTDRGATIRIEGQYAEAKGRYDLSLTGDGVLTVRYAFTVTERGKCDPRQIGLVFDLPAACQTLAWRRRAFWSSYPEDHIGRPQGTAAAFRDGVPQSGVAGPRVEPHWSWSLDGNRHGTNDFRSTKMNILEASLLSNQGNGLRVLSDGSQHVRCWVDGDRVRLLVADYTNEGTAFCFNEPVTPRRPLEPGTTVSGVVRVEIR